MATVASRKENVVIQASNCAVTLLPNYGGKIASILFSNHELLQQPLAPIAPRTRTMPFDESDASGWDECLPSVAACTLHTASAAAEIPDHGDLWRVLWTTLHQDAQSIHLAADCFSLPLRLERRLSIIERPNGARLSLDYKLTDSGHTDVPWSWAAHPLFATAEGDRILLPESVRTLRVEGSRGNRLGRNGDSVQWPIAALADGSGTDLSLAQSPASGIGDKLFAGPLTAHENWCALERPSAGVRIRVSFDPAATPYLGLWICYGGWPERPGPRQVCVAIEPATAPVDSLALCGPWSRTLAPGRWSKWTMHVDLESL